MKQRGISTVVGAVFMVLVILAGFNLIMWGVTYYDNYSAVLSERSRVEWEKMNEGFGLVDLRSDGGRFNITVVNTGSVTAHIVRLWVTNESSTPRWHRVYDIDYYIGPRETVTNIGQTLSLYPVNTSSYTLKLVTERGNIAVFKVFSPFDISPRLTLNTLPPSPIPGTDVDVLLAVTNNASYILRSITPLLDIDLPQNASATLIQGPEPSDSEFLPIGSTTFFKWRYRVSGLDGQIITFNATLAEARQGNFALANVTLREVSANATSSRGTTSSKANVTLSLHTIPPSAIDGQDIGVILAVMNNETNYDVLDIVPQLNVTTIGGATAQLVKSPTPASIDLLKAGSTVLFEWVYNVEGAAGDVIMFNGSITDAPQGRFSIANTTIKAVKYAEQSASASVAGGLSQNAPSIDGTLYFHKPTVLDGYQMDSSQPSGDEKKVTLNNGNRWVTFYTMNGTQDIVISDGKWNLTLFRKNRQATSINIKYEVVSQDGLIVNQTVLDVNQNVPAGDNKYWYYYGPSLGSVTVPAGYRLRVNITYLSGESIEIKWDKVDKASNLKTPTQTPSFPIFANFDGNDFWTTVTNTGSISFWVTYNTRVVFRNIYTNASYAGFLIGWKNGTAAEQSVDQNRDTGILKPNQSMALHFQQPRDIPTRNADKGNPIPSGYYAVYIHLQGYDMYGAFVNEIVYIGNVSF